MLIWLLRGFAAAITRRIDKRPPPCEPGAGLIPQAGQWLPLNGVAGFGATVAALFALPRRC